MICPRERERGDDDRHKRTAATAADRTRRTAEDTPGADGGKPTNRGTRRCPTGSQTVHDVAVVTVFEPDEIAAGLEAPGSTCFILTNTRSLPEVDAVALNTGLGRHAV